MLSTVIFTQAYNARQTIRRTINSILGQSCGDFEYYVLDNGSTDDTEDIIIEYSEIDDRIKPLHINKNDITNAGPVWTTLIHSTIAKYAVWCDADDEYTPDFLENMIGFSEENQLDIAACGYEKIDGLTGEITKHRSLNENLILYENLFADEFIKYRVFTAYAWGKLYAVPFLKSKKVTGIGTGTERKNRICDDSIRTLGLFKNADRAGVYGKAMYKYYQYPHSLSRTNIESSISSYGELWHATKSYLEYYGPISKINKDFLYAIHLSLVEEAVGNVFAAELATDMKLCLLAQIFSDPIWVETMTRSADPQFRNLAARKDYVSGVKSSILALPGAAEHAMTEGILSRLVQA